MAAAAQPGSDERDLDGGRLLAGLGALVLLISLFLDWYGESVAFDSGGADRDIGITAWNSFELIDILLAALAIATLAWVVEGLLGRSGHTPFPSRLGSTAGPVALTLVLVSIINEPPTLSVFDPDREIGIWVALAGAALMTIGSLLAIARISLVVSPRDGGSGDSPKGEEPARPESAFPEAETRSLSQEPGLHPSPR